MTRLLLLASLSCAQAAPPVPVADGFDFPVGPPDAEGFFDAQGFQDGGNHLGEDWNGPGGGDSDLGVAIHSIAAGRVSVAHDLGDNGWGRIVRVVHRLPDGETVESLYAHLSRIDVDVGQIVQRGERLGGMGTAHGRWGAHLHLELRRRPGAPIGAGYGAPGDLYLAPTPFIRAHRPAGR